MHSRASLPAYFHVLCLTNPVWIEPPPNGVGDGNDEIHASLREVRIQTRHAPNCKHVLQSCCCLRAIGAAQRVAALVGIRHRGRRLRSRSWSRIILHSTPPHLYRKTRKSTLHNVHLVAPSYGHLSHGSEYV
jgi:hypothetical protein